jgi:hypothetical protein
MTEHERIERERPAVSEEIGLIGLVQEGMRVIDAHGNDLGEVESVKMPSQGQVTPEGSEDESTYFLQPIVGSGEGPDVPEPMRSRLLMRGYVEIGGGLLGTDRYVPADLIAAVSGDVVRLAATREATVPEQR